MTMESSPPQDAQDPTPAAAARRRLSLQVITASLGVLGFVFILVVGSFLSWNEYRTVSREARDHARASASSLADHANRLFEVSDVALRSAALTIGDQDWTAIAESRSIWTMLHETAAFLPYVDDIWLNDATGLLRLTTFAFPAPASNAAGREIFRRVRTEDAGLVIGERFVGAVTNKATFLVARRLDNPDGSFRGMASVTLDLSYFPIYWSGRDLPNEERISFVRPQRGDVLTSYQKPLSGEPFAFNAQAFLGAVGTDGVQGAFEPDPKVHGRYHRVGAMPLYVTVEYTQAAIVQRWLAWTMKLLPLTAVAMGLLTAIMILGFRQARREARAARELEAAQLALARSNQTLERRVAERTADLQESNEEIQRFAYIVSHDLRAPLVNIMGFTAELQALRPELFARRSTDDPSSSEPADPVRQDFDEALGFIGSSIEKMDRLIKAILSLSRQGQRPFQPETLELTAFMRSMADGVAHRAQTAGVEIEIAPLPTLCSDRIALEQIFTNLIDNALKYLRPDTKGLVSLTGNRTANGVLLEIRDNGRGIDPRDHERIFELFRRAGPQDQPGEGIGLAHVRALVRRLGGKIAVRSQRGEGCVFVIDLPDMQI